jgi:hypothetical protein
MKKRVLPHYCYYYNEIETVDQYSKLNTSAAAAAAAATTTRTSRPAKKYHGRLNAMNSQLYAHLEAFDNGSDGNEDIEVGSPSLGNLANANSNTANTVDEDEDANITDQVESLCKRNMKPLDQEESVAFLRKSAMSYFPVVVASLLSLLRNYEELIAFVSITTVSFVWLVVWQQQQQQKQQQSVDRVQEISRQSQRKNYSSQQQPRQQIEGKSSMIRHNTNDSPSRSSVLVPSDDINSNNKRLEHGIFECRNELSRLLGLIGAPPMRGRNIKDVDVQHDGHQLGNIDHNNNNMLFKKIVYDDDDDNDDDDNDDDDDPAVPTPVDTEDCVAASTISVVSFLEAHVQVMLTLDKALYWLKISASLHWGLGPHSQCVERVERAAISKELLRSRHNNRRGAKDRRDCDNNRTNDVNNNNNNSIASQSTPTTSSSSSSSSSSLSSIRAKEARMDQPQNQIDSYSILALSSVRRNIAHVIVNEVHSIVNTLRIVDNCVARRKRKRLPNGLFRDQIINGNGDEANDSQGIKDRTDNDGSHNASVGEREHYHERIVKNEFLEMPDIIDIAWIKASRKYLSNLLTHTVDKFSTRDHFRTLSSLGENKHEGSLSESTQPLQTLSESMWTARNLRDYLMSHLLLDDDDDQSSMSSVSRGRSVRLIIRGGGVHNESDYILPLLQYKKQLDALDAALWSFQHYICYSQRVDDSASSHFSGDRATKENDKTQQEQEDHYHHHEESQKIMSLRSSSAKLTWWNQVKEISATCQTLQEKIGNRFFSPTEHDPTRNTEGNHGSSDECSVHLGKNSNDTACGAQSYEHTEGEKLTNNEQYKNPYLTTTKTLVFAGEGSKEKRSTNKMKQKSMVDDESGNKIFQSGSHSTAMPLPSARDTFTEQLLVRELQNRIRSVAALREEEQQVDLSRVAFQATCGEDEDHSSQEAMTADENTFDGVDSLASESCILMENATIVGAEEMHGKKRAIATNIFLGASGSLLDELKRNICPDHSTNIIENREIMMENDEVADGSAADDTFFT